MIVCPKHGCELEGNTDPYCAKCKMELVAPIFVNKVMARGFIEVAVAVAYVVGHPLSLIAIVLSLVLLLAYHPYLAIAGIAACAVLYCIGAISNRAKRHNEC